MANIVPHEVRELNMGQYNEYARRCATDLKSFIKLDKIPISVSISNEEIGLEKIITSPRARDFFNRYIGGYPTSYWDNAPIHRSKVVKDFIKDNERLHVEELPPYAPELNPVEHSWS